MSNDEAVLIGAFSKAQSPEETRDVFLLMGFTGVVFQRWHAESMDNWEGQLVHGFFEHYYAAQLYKCCPIALAIHRWSRDYTFAEARCEFLVGDEKANRAKSLWQQFGIQDGVVLFTGANNLKSAVVLMSDKAVAEQFDKLGGAMAYGARCLTRQLEPGNKLLSGMNRDDPHLSSTQNKILRLQVDHPELSNVEMAQRLGMSPKTLQSHHKKIAQKTGVTTFTGAVIQRMRESAPM
ncbi:MAG: hypothetical protein GY947_10485 [Rhodobacteraceae bacterium]|nr:hypothetical protein [Paracoccaceae bacterium]